MIRSERKCWELKANHMWLYRNVRKEGFDIRN